MTALIHLELTLREGWMPFIKNNGKVQMEQLYAVELQSREITKGRKDSRTEGSREEAVFQKS